MNPLLLHAHPGLLFALAGNLAAANKYHDKLMDSIAQDLADPGTGIFLVALNLMSVCGWATNTATCFSKANVFVIFLFRCLTGN